MLIVNKGNRTNILKTKTTEKNNQRNFVTFANERTLTNECHYIFFIFFYLNK